jgi:hypothetical protein
MLTLPIVAIGLTALVAMTSGGEPRRVDHRDRPSRPDRQRLLGRLKGFDGFGETCEMGSSLLYDPPAAETKKRCTQIDAHGHGGRLTIRTPPISLITHRG